MSNLKSIGKKVIDFKGLVKEYSELKSKEKIITDRKKLIAEQLKAYAQENGVKDSNGSYYVDTDNYIFGSQAKKSVSFNDQAIKFFKDNKMSKAIQVVEKINEKEVEKYIKEGKVTLEHLADITDTKVTYAIDVKEKKEMTEVEQSEVTLVASTKPKLGKRK